MDFTEFCTQFEAALSKNGLKPLDASRIRAFYEFNMHLLEVNRITNLTAIREMTDVIYKHDVDSLLAASYLPEGARVLDLGCGAGFPSVPLAIARPDLSVVALDSTAKKIAFVRDAAARLALDNLTALSGRAEDAAIRKVLGEFDAVTSRAVARMNVLAELCLPYARIGGVFVALKGAKADEEVAEAQSACRKLGGGKPICNDFRLVLADGTEEQRSVVVVRKEQGTPTSFPRQYAAILKKPL